MFQSKSIIVTNKIQKQNDEDLNKKMKCKVFEMYCTYLFKKKSFGFIVSEIQQIGINS